MKAITTVFVGLLSFSAWIQADVFFSDSDFNSADWELVKLEHGAGGSTVGSRSDDGGCPGAYRRITTTVNNAPGGSGVIGFHRRIAATYSPGLQGAIDHMDYSESAAMFSAPYTDGQATGPALRQSGKIYVYYWLITGQSASCHTLYAMGIKAANFVLVSNVGLDTNQHPDFSATGAPMELGFWRGNFTCPGCPGYSTDGRIDNWNIAIRGTECPVKTPLVVGGFNRARSGNLSFPSGDYFVGARAAISSNSPQTAFNEVPALTISNLVNIDILVLCPATDFAAATTPLSAEEQNALLDYVQRGGAAIILSDNHSYATTAPQVNETFLDPFGMDAYGTLGSPATRDPETAIVVSPVAHRLTSGPFGSIPSFTQYIPGSLSNAGPFGIPLATNRLGIALAVIEAGALGPNSGRVVVFSDINTFVTAPSRGVFDQNRALFLNVIDYCRRPSCGTHVTIRVSEVEICWNSRTNQSYQVQYRSDFEGISAWTPLPLAECIAGLGTTNCITDKIPLGRPMRFYQVVETNCVSSRN